jgi:protein-disulfide isomerase-like protein with CxxC motif
VKSADRIIGFSGILLLELIVGMWRGNKEDVGMYMRTYIWGHWSDKKGAAFSSERLNLVVTASFCIILVACPLCVDTKAQIAL